MAENRRAEDLDENVVQFEHKFFHSPDDIYFKQTEAGEPVAVLSMGGSEVVLTFNGIRKEFMLGDDSHDGKMLTTLAEAVKFVRGLRLGDPIPKEILTGEASWELKERHLQVAHQRLTMQLVSWMTGKEVSFSTIEELAQLAEDPTIRKQVSKAFDGAAEALGIGIDRREEVVQYIETLAKELAYIEAERDKFAEIKKIDEKVQTLRRIYSADKGVIETTEQVAKLSQIAVKSFQDIFDEVDGQTGEILAALRNIDNQIDYIRTVRDNLYRRQMPWEDLFTTWKLLIPVKSENSLQRIRELYQFLAPRFMKVSEWTLVSKGGTFAKKKEGGVMTW